MNDGGWDVEWFVSVLLGVLLAVAILILVGSTLGLHR